VLKGYDLLLMPTLPLKATGVRDAAEHRAVRRDFDEVSIYRAASALEKAANWKGIRP
jgi:hypothetical protein